MAASAIRVLRAIVAADLRQRVRGTTLWIAAAAVALGAWWCFPPVDAGYLVVAIGEHYRGRYSSAWIGMVIALLSMLWGLVGFYVVRGTLQRDFDTRVWQLLGASAMSRTVYLLARWTSHVLVLAGMLAIALAMGLAAQWMRAEDRHVDLAELLKPALFIALPMLGFSATLAVWFDLIKPLRRTAGSVLFFFLWMGLMSAGAVHGSHGHATAAAQPWHSDLPGIEMMQWAVDHQVVPQFPGHALPEGFCVGCGAVSGALQRFEWTHWDVAAAPLWGRVAWLAAALAGVLLAAPFLDRAGCLAGTQAAATRTRSPRSLRWLNAALAPLRRAPGGVLIAAEVFVVLRMRPLWWWAAWLPTWAAQLFAPAHGAAMAMLAGWALLLDAFSRACLREAEHGTGELVGTAPDARRRLLWARVAMLVGMAWIATWPGLARAAFTDSALGLGALMLGAALALWGLATAAATRSSRPFELAFVAIAYATTQGLSWLDAGARGPGVTTTRLVTVGIALALLLSRRSADRAGIR